MVALLCFKRCPLFRSVTSLCWSVIYTRIHELSFPFEKNKGSNVWLIICSIIRPKFLNSHPKLIFNQWHKLHNNKTNLGFVFKEKKTLVQSSIKSSIKIIKDLILEMFEILEGPHISVATKIQGLKLIFIVERRKWNLCFANSKTSEWRFCIFKFKSLKIKKKFCNTK